MSVLEEKKRLRARAKAARTATHSAVANAGERLQKVFVEAAADMGVPAPAAAVSAYWPLEGEMDVRPLLLHLHEVGYVCALPVVIRFNEPLIFRRWSPDVALEAGAKGTRHPPPSVPVVNPEVLLAPLLAFDALGHRLGYGAGFYDRSLKVLRAHGPVLAIGVAYAAQRVDTVPHSDYDEPLDWVVTEESALRTGRTP